MWVIHGDERREQTYFCFDSWSVLTCLSVCSYYCCCAAGRRRWLACVFGHGGENTLRRIVRRVVGSLFMFLHQLNRLYSVVCRHIYSGWSVISPVCKINDSNTSVLLYHGCQSIWNHCRVCTVRARSSGMFAVHSCSHNNLHSQPPSLCVCLSCT